MAPPRPPTHDARVQQQQQQQLPEPPPQPQQQEHQKQEQQQERQLEPPPPQQQEQQPRSRLDRAADRVFSNRPCQQFAALLAKNGEQAGGQVARVGMQAHVEQQPPRRTSHCAPRS